MDKICFKFSSSVPSLSSTFSHHVFFLSFKDKTGTLWFGIIGDASRYDGQSFTTFSAEQELANNSVQSIAKDKTGNLSLVGTNGGASRNDGQSLTSLSIW
jgi:ligand-binding sensor domain-containing protein